MRKYLILLCALMSASCTLTPNPETGMDADFHVPFQKKSWATSEYEDTANQRNFCVVSTGHNGIKVILRKDAGSDQLHQAVKSTRWMKPGMSLRVSVNNHVYRTSGEFFPSSVTSALIADLRHSGTSYLEWRELRSRRTGIQRFNTMISLDDFKSQYDACAATLK